MSVRRKSEQVWYHGDTSARATFLDQRWDRDRSVASANENGPGLYFTSSLEQAASYGSYVYMTTLPASFQLVPKRKPTLTALECLASLASPEDQEIFVSNWGFERPTKSAMRAGLSHYANQVTLFDALVSLYGDLIRDPEEWVQAMRLCGYDGVIVDRAYDIQHLIVYTPEKLAYRLYEGDAMGQGFSGAVIPFRPTGRALRDVTLTGAERLLTWDTGRKDARRQTIIGYAFWPVYKNPGKPLFTGSDFAGSPLHADDSDETLRALLGFLTLRPGDTDRDYFDSYTEEQMAYAEGDAEYHQQWTVDESEGYAPPFIDRKKLAGRIGPL